MDQIRSGRFCTVTRLPSASSTARSMAFSSSRTFPGHPYEARQLLGPRLEPGHRHLPIELPVEAEEEGPGQLQHVLAPRPQRRDGEVHHVQPVVEVLAELAPLHQLAEVAVGGGQDAHVHALRAVLAHRADLALLEEAEQLDLRRGGQLARLVEQERASVGLGEEAALGACGRR